jgi:Complex I intermediate-associated protein 30 (CIA30)
MPSPALLLDDFNLRNGVSKLGTRWQVISDQKIGGFSRPRIGFGEIDGTTGLVFRGTVVRMNQSGWIGIELPFDASGRPFDASAYTAVSLRAKGDENAYTVRLRTDDTLSAKQYYEASFKTATQWKDIHLPFASFTPHGLTKPLDTGKLTQIMIIAARIEGDVEMYLRSIGLQYPEPTPAFKRTPPC